MPKTEQNKANQPSVPAANTAPEAASQEQQAQQPATMEVPVAQMQDILQQLEDLKQRDELREQQMDRLRASGGDEDDDDDKSRKAPPRAHVMIHNGKVVTGWKMEKNELVYNPVNLVAPVSEDLQISVQYADGSKSGIFRYIDFVRNKERASVTKIGENGIMWVVRFEDPRIQQEDLEIDPQFLNP